MRIEDGGNPAVFYLPVRLAGLQTPGHFFDYSQDNAGKLIKFGLINALLLKGSSNCR